MTTNTTGEAGPCGPADTGTEKDALLQALRNIWPLLSAHGRQQAIAAADQTKKDGS